MEDHVGTPTDLTVDLANLLDQEVGHFKVTNRIMKFFPEDFGSKFEIKIALAGDQDNEKTQDLRSLISDLREVKEKEELNQEDMSNPIIRYLLFPQVVEKLQEKMKDEGLSPRKFAPVLKL